ncbi:DoxX family protein [Aureimonas leprariae]|uniref:DoxX family protein n=1 Tax=Plantimonas leprariae TaxID=2615207 RepID=UPI00138675CC|nr:DoxX family protein [Aureimonas leprariae]
MSSLINRKFVGRTLVGLVVGLLLADGLVQAASPGFMVAAMDHIGLPETFREVLPILTLTCAATLALPSTALIGAVLTTGFLGGAVSLHARIGEFGSPPQIVCLALGVAMWTGLLLWRPDLRQLLFRRDARPATGGQPRTA